MTANLLVMRGDYDMEKMARRYLTIDDIQKEYLPIGKKRLRILVKRYLPVKMIGNRMFVERGKLEELLKSAESISLDLGFGLSYK